MVYRTSKTAALLTAMAATCMCSVTETSDESEGVLAVIIDVMEDCNENGIDDALDIRNGTSSDTNRDGVPDECDEEPGASNPQGVVLPGASPHPAETWAWVEPLLLERLVLARESGELLELCTTGQPLVLESELHGRSMYAQLTEGAVGSDGLSLSGRIAAYEEYVGLTAAADLRVYARP